MEQAIAPIGYAGEGVSVSCDDEVVVARLISKLREAMRLSPLKLAVEVGKLVIHDLHGGDLTSWRHRGEKDLSLRKLCEHPDFPENLSPSEIYRAVGIFEMSTRLDIWAWKKLEYSHFRAVLPVLPELQAGFLDKAEAEGWTVAQLESEVAGLRRLDPGRRGGRPALPRFVKALNGLEKMAKQELLLADLDKVAEMDPEQVRNLENRVGNLLERLGEVHQALRTGLPASNS